MKDDKGISGVQAPEVRTFPVASRMHGLVSWMVSDGSLKASLPHGDLSGTGYMKKTDWILIPLILIISLLPLFSSQEDSSVVVIRAGGKTYRYSVNQNQQTAIPGPLGDTVVEIKEGKVRILSSPCPNRTCMRGSISRYPESLVCLPNDVIIQIESEGETDAVTF